MSKSLLDITEHDSQASELDQLAFPTSSTTTNEHEMTKFLPEKPAVLLKTRKAKQSKATPKQRFLARQKYFTAGSKIDKKNARCLDEDPSPYSYPKDLDELAQRIMTKAWRDDVRRKELKVNCFNKTSYQGRRKADLLNRLYVEEPKVESMKTVLDIDPQYFKVIEGRPIPDSHSIRDYIEINKECLRTRIINGYREDDIRLIEENLVHEQKLIDSIQVNYQKYVNIFEEFLYRDHSSAMKLLKLSQEAADNADEKYWELKACSKKYDAAKSSLYQSEQKWRNCKLYQRFLHNVSPVSWRSTSGCNMKSKSISIYVQKPDQADESDIFGKFRQSIQEKAPSLSDILEAFREEVKNDTPPEIYFTEPEELMEVFQYMQIQNLNSLMHTEEMAIPLANIKDAIKDAEKLFDVEIKSLQAEIDFLEGGIRWEEERAEYMEEQGKNLINKDFRTLITDHEVLNLHVFVEDVYETRVGPNDADLTMLEMMKGIEEKYRNELLSFDKLPSDQITMLEGSCYQEQMTVMQLAEMAAREYANLEKLNYRLTKAFEPPFKKAPSKEPKKRSPPVEPPEVVLPPPRSLTEAEEEFLEYFTDFCKYTDDPTKYGIDTRARAVGGMMRLDFEERTSTKRSRYVSRVKGVDALENLVRAKT
ncbi:unnamed protein product [Phaedon cochleariae]|uniref:Uncharacterized protein n=1 Tax=Phaedon cochleariae TaxID=80249 RepID=A0A9P0DM58_PHACE|nr:unnamed protein product [Phaedon cochleariae]